ncbi:retropepsin-like aspartic protease [Dissulfurimicrobium hydrothermale]|uniref:retropepsin-like aspartic protease n=1 Tax=Dissulfurimicrobium hydrothermale TaxID=1750598 RepID=UPI001EDA5F6F|nr:retropepsin-like aspartic protease [Dissulfurimicrobium hydrothermale]UKL13750.1 retroviral-like aspartic protease family protein [Dissulfurimicrobium hydrothermale]
MPNCIKNSDGIFIPTCVDTNNVTRFTGTITLTDEIVTATNNGSGGATNSLTPNGTPATVNVTVYLQSIKKSTGEMTLNTSDWLDLNLDIPITKDLSGALYVLVEHKSLAPGQTFAYRYDPTNGPQFYYFSQWGQPVNNAQLLYYAADVHNTPIAIPFTGSASDNTIPYGQTDVVSTIPIRFGAGMRLIGMEGDMIIHVLIGDPNDIQNYASWRELLYYVLHIEPVTGTWTVTEYYKGQPYTYTNYPLFLYEKRGVLNGIWDDPHGRQQLYVSYGNPSDQVCTNSLAVQGHRFNAQGCEMTGGYQIYFNEPTAFGQIEYLYQISKLTRGSLSGEYMYRMLGDANWSMPEPFSAVRREVVVPLDPTTNSYQVNGTVTGPNGTPYAVHFIIDTGAYTVLLDQSIAPYIGFTDLTTDPRCSPCGATVAGGATIQVTCCTVSNITVEGQLSKDNVSVAFGTQPGPSLLGMSFLNSFHISTDATDGSMTIAP